HHRPLWSCHMLPPLLVPPAHTPPLSSAASPTATAAPTSAVSLLPSTRPRASSHPTLAASTRKVQPLTSGLIELHHGSVLGDAEEDHCRRRTPCKDGGFRHV